jgi:RpiR family transcriptional regulator, carbohydrate utilization regulator
MDSLLFLLESKLDSLPDSELKIARYILKEKKNVIHQKVIEIAKATGASPSAVVRLCKSLGIPGFQEMKIMLARDVFAGTDNGTERNEPTDLTHADAETLLRQTSTSSIECIQDLTSTVLMSELNKTVQLLEQAEFIHVFGLGLSNGVAYDFAHKMQRLGYLCGYYQDNQMQMISASNMKKGMLGMVISHSGNTAEMVKAAKIMKSNGVSVITITGNRHGDISFFSDIVLLAPLSEPLKRQGASSSRISQLVLIDTLFSLIISHDPDEYSKKIKRTYDSYDR